MHNGLFLGTANFERQQNQLTITWDYSISPVRQQDVESFLLSFLQQETQPILWAECDYISMVTPHLYGFRVVKVTQSHIDMEIEVAEEFSKEEEKELLSIMEARKEG